MAFFADTDSSSDSWCVVYIKGDTKPILRARKEINDHLNNAIAQGDINSDPHDKEQTVVIPGMNDSVVFDLDEIHFSMAVKRMTGVVKKWYAFRNPLP